MEIVRSQRGRPKLCVDGYAYIVDRVTGFRYYWKCEDYKRCYGRAVTLFNAAEDRHELVSQKKHMHPPKKSRADVLRTEQLMKTCALITSDPPGCIIKAVTSTTSPEVLQALPSKVALTQAIRRARLSATRKRLTSSDYRQEESSTPEVRIKQELRTSPAGQSEELCHISNSLRLLTEGSNSTMLTINESSQHSDYDPESNDSAQEPNEDRHANQTDFSQPRQMSANYESSSHTSTSNPAGRPSKTPLPVPVVAEVHHSPGNYYYTPPPSVPRYHTSRSPAEQTIQSDSLERYAEFLVMEMRQIPDPQQLKLARWHMQNVIFQAQFGMLSGPPTCSTSASQQQVGVPVPVAISSAPLCYTTSLKGQQFTD